MDERAIFLAALDQPTPAEREAWLNQACGGDARLAQRIRTLLRRHEDAGSFLERPAAEIELERTLPPSGDTKEDGDHPTETRTMILDEGQTARFEFLTPSSKPGCLGSIGQYEVYSLLGEGGMAFVFKAHDTRLHRTVAVKVLKPELAANAAARQRFVREARAAAAVTHPHVVTIHAVDEDRLPFLVMEMVDGKTLRDKINAVGMLGVKEILRIGSQVASGLAAAHKQGLIHRDIKPANILLENGVERVKITDFGLARAVDDLSLTRTGEVAGTPQFMSPEQAQGEAIDTRSDLFSLGGVLYAMCTGRAPFRGDSLIAILRRVIDDPQRPIREINSEIPDWLCGIIDRLMDKKPEKRYQSAAEVAALLEQHLSHLQHPPSAFAAAPASETISLAPGMLPRGRTGEPAGARGSAGAPSRSSDGTRRRAFIAMGALAAVALLTAVIVKMTTRDTQPHDPSQGSPPSTAGWHGWPADAPPPAIAPFDAGEAKKHQEEWAKYLGVPVEFTNSIGMKFRLIPPGEYETGVTRSEDEIQEALKAIASYVPIREEFIRSEGPRHRVVVTRPLYLGVHEVTQAQFEKVMGRNPSCFASTSSLEWARDRARGLDTTNHPVEGTSWFDAVEFCNRLSRDEGLRPSYFVDHDNVTIYKETGYRLPTEAEWELGCRAGTTTDFWAGNEADLVETSWIHANADGRTHPVGERAANPFGLFDMHGNVSEWAQDWWDPKDYQKYADAPAVDPTGPPVSVDVRGYRNRVVRGGWWSAPAACCRSSSRSYTHLPASGVPEVGFRVAMTVEKGGPKKAPSGPATKAEEAPLPKTAWHGWPVDAPPPAIAPFDAKEAKQHQEAWAKYLKIDVEYTNSLGMKFRLITPGEFLMGSTPDEIQATLKAIAHDKFWAGWVESETPKHRVIITQPFFVSAQETTQQEFEAVMGTSPSAYAKTGKRAANVVGLDTSRHPVDSVTFNEAVDFCIRLSLREKRQPFHFRSDHAVTLLSKATGYRLPSEAEWELFCRAGTRTDYSCGETSRNLLKAAWFNDNWAERTHAVGELEANPFGLFDVHGNVWEWCQDGYDSLGYGRSADRPTIDPRGDPKKTERVARGGWAGGRSDYCRSAMRHVYYLHDVRDDFVGFRVTLPWEAGLKDEAAVAEPFDKTDE